MNYNKNTILIFLGLGLILIGFIFFNKNIANNNFQDLTILEEIKSKIGGRVDIESKDGASFRWVKDGYTILVPATENFYINKQNDKHLEFEEVPNLFEKELSIVKNVLKNRGFVLSEENSSANFSDRTFYDYIQSYQKNNNLCVIRINPDDLGYYQFIFSCGNSLNEAYEEQLPFLEVLNYKNTNNAVRLMNQSGDFYQVGVGSIRGGSTAILKKENGTYRVLYIRQEDPRCDEIENENIPNETLKLFKIGGCSSETGYRKFE